MACTAAPTYFRIFGIENWPGVLRWFAFWFKDIIYGRICFIFHCFLGKEGVFYDWLIFCVAGACLRVGDGVFGGWFKCYVVCVCLQRLIELSVLCS